MADQNLNVNLSIDSAQYVQGVSKAASKTESIGAAADGASDSLASMEQTAVSGAINITRAEKILRLQSIKYNRRPKKKGFFAKLGETSIKFNAIAATAKKISEPLKKVVVTLQEIGEKAQALGVGGDSPQVPSKIGAPCKARRFCGGGAADCNVRSAIG